MFKRSIGSKFDELDFDTCSADKSGAQYKELVSLFSEEYGFECFNLLKVRQNSRFYKFEEGKDKLDKILSAKRFIDRQYLKKNRVFAFCYMNNVLVVKRLSHDLFIAAIFKKIDFSSVFSCY